MNKWEFPISFKYKEVIITLLRYKAIYDIVELNYN